MGKLKEHMVETLGNIRHWQDDVACGLKPTMESLNTAEVRILGLFRDPELEAAQVDFDLRQAVRNAQAIQMRRAEIMQIINQEIGQ